MGGTVAIVARRDARRLPLTEAVLFLAARGGGEGPDASRCLDGGTAWATKLGLFGAGVAGGVAAAMDADAARRAAYAEAVAATLGEELLELPLSRTDKRDCCPDDRRESVSLAGDVAVSTCSSLLDLDLFAAEMNESSVRAGVPIGTFGS